MDDGEQMIDAMKFPNLKRAVELLWGDNMAEGRCPSEMFVMPEDEGGSCDPVAADMLLGRLSEDELVDFCMGDVDEIVPVLIEKYGEEVCNASRLLNQIFETMGA